MRSSIEHLSDNVEIKKEVKNRNLVNFNSISALVSVFHSVQHDFVPVVTCSCEWVTGYLILRVFSPSLFFF